MPAAADAGRTLHRLDRHVPRRGPWCNDHQLHIFTRPVFEQLCREFFEIEQIWGKPRRPDPARAFWKATDDERAADWWLMVGMTDPFLSKNLEFRHGLLPAGVTDGGNLLAFERDYDRPWLLRTLIALGFRTDAASVLERLAKRSILASTPSSADRGAALCVAPIFTWIAPAVSTPRCWSRSRSSARAGRDQECLSMAGATSLRASAGLARCRRSRRRDAGARTLRDERSVDLQPAARDQDRVGGVAAGWMALQSHDLEGARNWWTHGITGAERAMQRPWEELLVSWSAPIIFGLREAAEIVDIASQCAAGLNLLPHAADRPGVVAAQLAESMSTQLERYKREERMRRAGPNARRRGAEAPKKPVKPLPRATALLRSPLQQVPSNLKVAIFGVGPAARTRSRSCGAAARTSSASPTPTR